MFAPLAILLAAIVVLHGPKARRARTGSALVAAALLLVTAHAYAANVEIDRYWGREIGEPDLQARTVQQFSILAWSTHGDELIDRMIDDGAPAYLAPPLERTTGAWEWWQAKRVDCRDGLEWVGDHFTGWMVRHLATHPGDARDYFRSALASASHERSDGAASLPSPMMPLVSSLIFGNDAATTLVALALVALGFGAVRRTWPAWPLVGLVAAGVVALLVTGLLSALDVARVGLSAAVLVRLDLILRCLDVAGRRPTEPNRAGAL